MFTTSKREGGCSSVENCMMALHLLYEVSRSQAATWTEYWYSRDMLCSKGL